LSEDEVNQKDKSPTKQKTSSTEGDTLHANMLNQQHGDTISGIQLDWEHRTLLQSLTFDMVRIASFLNQFELTTRSKLSLLNTKLDYLERQLDQLEGKFYTFEQGKDKT